MRTVYKSRISRKNFHTPVSFDGELALIHEIMVYEEDNNPRETGLLDNLGNPLVAYTVKDQIGFVRFKDE